MSVPPGCEVIAAAERRADPPRISAAARWPRPGDSFTGTSMAAPLRLLDAQAWNEGMSAILAETRTVLASMKEGAKTGKKKR